MTDMDDEAMKEMARRIAQENADSAQECLFGPAIDQTVRRVLEDALAQAALAAIIETTARAAELAEDWLQSDYDESANCTAQQIRDELLSGVHLKGSPL